MHDCCVLISSTIFPREGRDKLVVKSVYSGEERLQQTRATIESLRSLGYDNIHLFDNSGREYQEIIENAFQDIHIKVFDHYQYDNKGISETLLLLDGLKYVPDNCSIIKLSGRYQLSSRLELDGEKYDLAARFYEHGDRSFSFPRTMATRCYMFKDKATYDRYLIGLLEEIYSYSARIYGFGSLKRFFINQFSSKNNTYSYFDPNLSVEAASIGVIEKLSLSVFELERIGLSGMAGTFENLPIRD